MRMEKKKALDQANVKLYEAHAVNITMQITYVR